MNITVNKGYNEEMLEELHKIQLEILKEFIKVCNKYAIPYFAVNGLAVGSIKYQGFIPWNKEIDVGMLRKDYDRFREVFQKELNECYRLIIPEKDNHFTYPVPRLQEKGIKEFQDKNRAVISENERFINIIPFDYIAVGKKEKRKQRIKTFFWKKLLMCCNVDEISMNNRKMNLAEKFLNFIMTHVLFEFMHIYPEDVYRRFTDAASLGNKNGKKSRILADFSQNSKQFTVIHKRDIFPTKDLPFEDIMICVPGNIEKYIKEICSENLRDK